MDIENGNEPDRKSQMPLPGRMGRKSCPPCGGGQWGSSMVLLGIGTGNRNGE